MTTDPKIDEVLQIVRNLQERSEDRDRINNARFEHLSRGIDGLRIEMREVKAETTKMNGDLSAKINHVHHSLSQDIDAFAGAFHNVDRRVTRLEKKLLS